MGYQVGNICYDTVKQAEDAYYSAVLPVIANDGSLKQLGTNGNGWYLDGVKLTASLPTCSHADYYAYGYELASALLPTAIVLMTAKVIIKFFWGASS